VYDIRRVLGIRECANGRDFGLSPHKFPCSWMLNCSWVNPPAPSLLSPWVFTRLGLLKLDMLHDLRWCWDEDLCHFDFTRCGQPILGIGWGILGDWGPFHVLFITFRWNMPNWCHPNRPTSTNRVKLCRHILRLQLVQFSPFSQRKYLASSISCLWGHFQGEMEIWKALVRDHGMKWLDPFLSTSFYDGNAPMYQSGHQV
jgi:hypothetical protein